MMSTCGTFTIASIVNVNGEDREIPFFPRRHTGWCDAVIYVTKSERCASGDYVLRNVPEVIYGVVARLGWVIFLLNSSFSTLIRF